MAAAEMLQKIQSGERFSTSEDGNYGRELNELLTENGFKPYNNLSRCKVASFESHLQKENTKIEIIVSNFMGVFTQVRCYF